MVSLFEYLGKAAGTDLGKEVYVSAAQNGVRWEKKKVSTKTYTGDVMVYPESFLNEYFKGKADEHKAKELTEVGLPPIDDSTPF